MRKQGARDEERVGRCEDVHDEDGVDAAQSARAHQEPAAEPDDRREEACTREVQDPALALGLVRL